MASPFGTLQTLGGAFTAEHLSLDIGIADGAIVQKVQFQIERSINLIYEIPKDPKTAKVYYVGGRARGQATFERVVGGSATFTTFITNYGNLCEPSTDIVLKAKGGCSPGSGAASSVGVMYTLIAPKIQSLGASVSAQDVIILESVTMMFLDIKYDAGGGGGGAAGGGPRRPSGANNTFLA